MHPSDAVVHSLAQNNHSLDRRCPCRRGKLVGDVEKDVRAWALLPFAFCSGVRPDRHHAERPGHPGREQPAAVRRAGGDRRAAPRGAGRRGRPLPFENVPPGNYHVGVRAEGYSTRRTEVTVAHLAGDARPRGRVRSALRRSRVGQPQRAAAVRVVSADVGAGGPGARQAARSHHRRARCPRRPAWRCGRSAPRPARPVIRGLDGDRVVVLEDGQRMGDLSSQSGDHGVPINPAAAQARSKWCAVRRRCSTAPTRSAASSTSSPITIPTEKTTRPSGNVHV